MSPYTHGASARKHIAAEIAHELSLLLEIKLRTTPGDWDVATATICVCVAILRTEDLPVLLPSLNRSHDISRSPSVGPRAAFPSPTWHQVVVQQSGLHKWIKKLDGTIALAAKPSMLLAVEGDLGSGSARIVVANHGGNRCWVIHG